VEANPVPSPQPVCTLVIADDDSTSRCWLRGLAKRLGFSVSAEAANGDEAIQAVIRTKPDLVLLDVSMPIKTGPHAIPAIIAAHPAVRVVMLTSIADEGTVTECIEKGAVGYIRKDSSADEINRVLASLRAEIEGFHRQKGLHVGP